MFQLEIPAAFIVTQCAWCGNEHAPIRPCEKDS